jgi:large subunit ribosomal protein L32
MPVPKRKRSRARRDSRFANKGIEIKQFATCKNCSAATMPHQVCRGCGHYKGIKVLITKSERALKRNEIKQARVAQHQQVQPRDEQPTEE